MAKLDEQQAAEIDELRAALQRDASRVGALLPGPSDLDMPGIVARFSHDQPGHQGQGSREAPACDVLKAVT